MVGLTDAELDHIDDVTAVMEDANTGHGYKTTSTSKSDGTPKRGRASLSCEDAAALDYAKSQVGVSAFGNRYFRDKGLVTHWKRSDSSRTLGSQELEDLTETDKEAIKAKVLAKMGLTLSDWERLSEVPCNDKGLVAKFDAAVYKIKESGGRLHDLARCLGIPLKRKGGQVLGCPRLQDALARHRDRLANPDKYGVFTCAAIRCDTKFYRQKPTQLYCSSPCQQSERNRRIRLRKKAATRSAA